MRKLFSIGEVLIDFIPLEKGVALKDVLSFEILNYHNLKKYQHI